jgi:restriction system protein
MPQAWMIRAEGGEVIDDFAKGYVALGWADLGDLAKSSSRDAIRDLYLRAYPDQKPSKANGQIAMLYKFRSVMQRDDKVVSYDPQKREYLVGAIGGDYFYDPKVIPDFPHLRKVVWEGRVSRDRLPVASRNSLGSTLTVFSLNDDVWASIATDLKLRAKTGNSDSAETEEEEEAELQESREVTAAAAHELIKDQVIRLDAADLEHLTAALLRAMGYRTRVTPKGPDRGVDVIASPDGLGFQEPRIKVEVKHRSKTQMGSQELRSFIGGLREGDCGLYVSSGGFTKEAKYEAERSQVPVTLLDLDDLVRSIVTHYEAFDNDGRTLLPLARVYWPVPS